MRALEFLYPYLLRYLGPVLSGIFWLAVTNLLGALLPWLLKIGIDAIEAGQRQRLLLAALLLALAAVLRGGARLLSRFRFLHSARAVEIDLRRDLLRGLLGKDLGFFDRHRTGDLLSRFTNDLANVRMLAGFGVLTMANAVLVYLVTLVMLLQLSPRLTLIALIPYPLMFLLVKVLSRRTMQLSTEVQESLGRVSEAVEETVSGATVVRAFNLGPLRKTHFDRCNHDYLARNLALARLRSVIMPVMSVVGPLGTLLTLYFGGQMVTAGTLSIGELVAFSAYLGQLIWPTLTLGWVLTLTQRCAASLSRLATLLDETPAAASLPADPVPTPPAVQIHALDFGYADTPVLHALELTIPAGTLVGVVGPTASGKSTLLRLLTGLYPLPAGHIAIDGVDLTRLDLRAHRARLAVVPQEGRLLSGTVRDNLLYGVPDADPERLRDVARQVALLDDIEQFPAQFDTRVGEGGVALSGGQRQRVCLGRALARDGALWLLDDPLSHLDAATARAVWRELRRHLRERTVLLAAGRVSLLAEADLIIVLDQGRIVARGRHAELLAASPLYARLAEQERLRDELETLA